MNWLDRGELDKIVERSAQTGSPVRETQDVHPAEERRQPYSGKKKKSFLGDMFDFD